MMECFSVNSNEIKGRFDPFYLRNRSVIEEPDVGFDLVPLGDLLKEPIQYGANETAIDGDPSTDARYIRITDIDKYGNLKNDDWKTAKTIEDRYLLKDKDILFARSGATAGKCFIFKKEYGRAIFGGYLIRFRFDETKVNPKYIFYYTQSSRYQLWVKSIQRPAGQPNINSAEYKSFRIPLPSSDGQEKYISLMDNAYAEKNHKESNAKNLISSISDYVLRELGINLPPVYEQKTFLVSSDEIENRHDPFFYRPDFKEIRKQLTSVNHAELSEVVEFSKETWSQKGNFTDTFPYIEISEIDISTGEILNINYCKIEEAPSRARMVVRENDIIVSMTRPNRGAISMIDASKDGFIASTGFAVLRDITVDDLDRKYLFYFLRTEAGLNQMLQRSSGGNYPAITTEQLKRIIVPIPPKEVQGKIANEVRLRVKKIKQLRAESIKELEYAKKEAEKMILGD